MGHAEGSAPVAVLSTDGGAAMTLAAAIAHHEAGHAVAVVAAFRAAVWLPKPRPSVLVRKVEIAQDAAGEWIGRCVAMDIYSTGHVRRKPLMRSLIAIHL